MSQRLPLKLKKYFWDCSFDELSLANHMQFIVERVLMFGNTSDIQWVIKVIPMDDLKRAVFKSRRLDNKTRNFWEFYFKHGGNQISYFAQ